MIDETVLKVATLLNEGGNARVGSRKREYTTRKVSQR
jgi:hypothetical protein